MKRKLRIVVTLLAAVLTLVCAAMFAACQDEDKLYKLSFVADGKELSSIETTAGSDLTLPGDPVKEGYLFVGWYLTADFSGEIQELPAKMPEENRTYYARFAELPPATSYKLEFVADGLTIPAIEAKAGETITPPDDPEKAGYEFEGWFENAQFTGNAVELPTKMPEGNKTYYAKFAQIFKLEFVADGLTIPAIEAKAGETITPPDDPEKAGYEFEGWFENAQFTGNAVELPTEMPEGNKTYYAKFAQIFKLEFVADGLTIPAIEAKAGETITPPDDPEKEGYEFEGWFENAQFTGNAVELPTKMPEGNKTYYAKFLAQYTLTFHSGLAEDVEVTGEMAPMTFVATKAQTLTQNAFGAEGYLFLGWAKEAGGEVLYENGASVTIEENTDLYGVWQKGIRNQWIKGDYLYLDGADAVLVRGGMTYEGSYDAAKKTFKTGDFAGRVFENDTFACYGDHVLGEYKLYDETIVGDTLTLADSEKAVYRTEAGQETKGTYTYDLAENCFVFTDGAQMTFSFLIGVYGREQEETLVFQKRDALAGNYYSYEGGELFVDGFGYATMSGLGSAISESGSVSLNGEYYYYLPAESLKDQDEYAPDDLTDVYCFVRNDDDAQFLIYVRLREGVFAIYDWQMDDTYAYNEQTFVFDGFNTVTQGAQSGNYYCFGIKGFEDIFVQVELSDDGQTGAQFFKIDCEGKKLSAIGVEIGIYDRYADWMSSISESGSSYNYRVTLDGVGGAKMERKSARGSSYSVYAEGTYTYDTETGTGTFTSDVLTTKFALVLHSNGSFVYVQYNAEHEGNYTNGADKLELDGYDLGLYTVNGGDGVVGRVKFDGTTVTFMPVDGGKDIIFVLDKAQQTFSFPNEAGIYQLNTNRGSNSDPKENDKRMTLDGAGNATIDIAEDNYWSIDWEKYVSGTYALVEGTTDVWKFTPSASDASKQPEFLFTLSGTRYTVITGGEGKTYTADGAELKTDGFGGVTYTADGAVHSGKLKNADEGYLAFTDEEGTEWLFRLDGESFVKVGLERGSYTLVGHETLTLDGEGKATLGEGDMAVEGTYSVDGDGYRFVSENVTFGFLLDGNKYRVAYKNADEYLGAADFTRFVVYPYDDAVFYYENGTPLTGTYTALGECVVAFKPSVSGQYLFYIRLDMQTRTFSFVEDEYVVDGTVLVAYQGEETAIVIPDGVTEIADGVFKGNTTILSVDLNQVTVIGASVFENCSALVSVEGTGLTALGDRAFYGTGALEKIVLHGEKAPEMGNDTLSYSTDTLLIADSLEIALKWYAAQSWSSYVKHLGYNTAVAAIYYDLSGLGSNKAYILENGIALLGNNSYQLYKLEGNTLTLYTYSASAETKYTEQTVTITDGVFTVGDKFYAEPQKTVVYKEGEDTLTVVLGEPMTFTFNSEDITVSMDIDGKITFPMTIGGAPYTVTISTYSADATLQGTFRSEKKFKEVTIYLNGKQGTPNANSRATIKQTGPDSFELSSSAYMVSESGSKTISSGKSSRVFKSAEGFYIVDVKVSPYQVYKLTVDDDNKFTFTVEECTQTLYETTCKVDKDTKVGVGVYKDASGNVLKYVLRLPSYASTASYTSLDDIAATCTVQDDGTLVFTDIASPSFAAGYTFTVTLQGEDSCTVTATKA